MDSTIRDAILEAAERLIGRFGFAKVTVEDIAQEAQVARATVYLHFRSKNEIGLASADKTHERLLGHLRQLAELDAPAIERLRQMLVGRVLFAFDAAQNISVKFEDMFAALKPQYMARREQYFANEAKIFLKVLKEGQQKREFIVDDAPATALALVLSTNSLMPFSLNARQLKARKEIETLAAKIAGMMLHGLRADEAKRKKHGA